MNVLDLLEKNQKKNAIILHTLLLTPLGTSKEKILNITHLSSFRNLYLILNELNSSAMAQKFKFNITWDSNLLYLHFSSNKIPTFNELLTFMLIHSDLYNILIQYLTKKQVTETYILDTYNISRANYYRKLVILKEILNPFNLYISKGRLVGSFLQKCFIYYELLQKSGYSFVESSRNLINNKYISTINELIGQKNNIGNIVKLNAILITIYDVAQSLKSNENPILPKLSFTSEYLNYVLREFKIISKKLTSSKTEGVVLFIFVLCYISCPSSKLLSQWSNYCLICNNKIYRFSKKIYKKLFTTGAFNQESNAFLQLIQVHTASFFMKGTITHNYMLLNALDIRSNILNSQKPILNILVYKQLKKIINSSFISSTAKELVPYYASILYSNLSTLKIKLVIGIYSQQSIIINNYIKSVIYDFTSNNIQIDIRDLTFDDKVDLIITDSPVNNIINDSTPKYCIHILGSTYDYMQIGSFINKIIINKIATLRKQEREKN